jgi:hypothetical protein
MAKRFIHLEFYTGGEPSEGNLALMTRAFADLGWKLDYSFGGGSNVDRWGLTLESEDSAMTYAALLATLRQFEIPVPADPSGLSVSDPYCPLIQIGGDWPMPRQTVEWPLQRAADVGGLHLEILGIALCGECYWQDRRLREAEIRCVLSPRGNQPLPLPVVFTEVRVVGEDDKPLSDWNSETFGEGRIGETVFKLSTSVEQPTSPVNVFMRILDLHRAGEVVFRSVPVVHWAQWSSVIEGRPDQAR